MNKEIWDRVVEAAQGNGTIDAADLALALIEMRFTLERLSASYDRCQESLHHIDKQLAKVSVACHVMYSRVTAELVGE